MSFSSLKAGSSSCQQIGGETLLDFLNGHWVILLNRATWNCSSLPVIILKLLQPKKLETLHYNSLSWKCIRLAISVTDCGPVSPLYAHLLQLEYQMQVPSFLMPKLGLTATYIPATFEDERQAKNHLNSSFMTQLHAYIIEVQNLRAKKRIAWSICMPTTYSSSESDSCSERNCQYVSAILTNSLSDSPSQEVLQPSKNGPCHSAWRPSDANRL